MIRNKEWVKTWLKMRVPEETIMDILRRLPAKSLVRFKSASKQWRSLISSDRFIKMHLNRSTLDNRTSLHVLTSPYSDYDSYDLLQYEESSLEGTVSDLLLPWSISFPLMVVGSCNGLLCITSPYKDDISLWNPSIHQTNTIPAPLFSSRCRRDVVGFGYDPSIDDYKVVRIRVSPKAGLVKRSPAEVYTLKTNSWKKIQGVPFHIWHDSPRCPQGPGTLVDGTIYWKVSGFFLDNVQDVRDFDPDDTTQIIICFDLLTEKFRLLYLPSQMGGDPDPKFYLTVYGGCLCVVQDDGLCFTFEFWVLKKHGEKKAWWSKLMSIPRLEYDGKSLAVIGFSRNGQVLMANERHRLTRYEPFKLRPHRYGKLTFDGADMGLYSPEEDMFNELLLPDLVKLKISETEYRQVWSQQTPYVESLVSPKDVGGAEVVKKWWESWEDTEDDPLTNYYKFRSD